MELKLKTIDSTIEAGKEISHKIGWQSCVAIVGDLGAGKTTFTKGFVAEKLDYDAQEVSSPSYSLINSYVKNNYEIHHIDLYRLKSLSEVEELGLFELLHENSILIIEWANQFPEIFEQCDWIIQMTEVDGGRVLQLSKSMSRDNLDTYNALLNKVLKRDPLPGDEV